MSVTRTSYLGGLGAVLVLSATVAASADPSWQLNGLRLNPGSSPADLIAATDRLMASPIGKQAPGRLLLLVNMADGDDPDTNAYVILNKSAADGEAYGAKLFADSAFAQFEAELAKLSTGGATVRNRTVKSWGDFSDADVVWLTVYLAVKDEAAVLAARDRWGASESGKKFPGQAHLSAVVAGGAGPVTHVLTVGYASEAEMESWGAQSRKTAEWQAYQKDLRAAADVLGFALSRTLKAWGPATMKDLSVQ
jgi:hypothetical protein